MRQSITYTRYARTLIRPIHITTTIECKMAKWIDGNQYFCVLQAYLHPAADRLASSHFQDHLVLDNSVRRPIEAHVV